MAAPNSTPEPPVVPLGARFDPHTGAELSAGAGAGGERRQSYALQPGEPVASFNLVTSLMPLAAGRSSQTYRWALAVGILIPVVAGALGFLAFAFVAAAVVVPAIYVVYMYDVNQWEDQPLGVVLGALGAATALGVGFTFIWHAGLLGGNASTVDFDGNGNGVRWTSLLVLVLLVPVASEVLKQAGPLLLASRPAFDDMIDGLTFGVAAGAAFAAAETIVVNRGLFSSFGQIDSPDAGFWVSLVLSAAVVKPIVYGAATGIAVASFSGLGAGYDGFKPAYVRGLVEALLANVLFQGGLFFAARLEGTTGAVVGLVWGALIAVALVVRLRYLLHFAVLEAALAAAAGAAELKDTAHGTAYCPSCEMPLLSGANFCVACGTSVRAAGKVARARNRVDDLAPPAEGAVAEPVKPTLDPLGAGVAPQDASTTAVVVVAVAATILIAGFVGQAAAAAAADESAPAPPVQIQTQVGSGPTTEPPPEPAPAPGPTPDPSEPPPAEPTTSQSMTDALGTVQPAFSPNLDGGIDTTEPPAPGEPGTSSASTVDLGSGYSFELPPGYEVEAQEDGFAQVFGDNGYFFALVTPSPADLETMIVDHLTGLQGLGIQDLEISDPEPVQVPSSAVVQAITLGYQGALASQQGGAVPVEGFAYYFLTQDGTGVTAFALYPQGLTEDDPLTTGLVTMLGSLVSSF